MAVKLSSYRVAAAMDATAYAAGMAQKVAADKAGAASSAQVGAAITATQSKVSQSGDVLTRLSRGYLEGFAQAERFTRAIYTLGRGVESGNVPMARAEAILDGIYRKFGMTANAADLAEQGHYQLAAAVDTLNAKLAAESGALDANSAAQQRNNAVLALRRNLMFQMVDIGQGIPLLFQSPVHGLLNLGNQMAQIGQSYYGQGGMGAALRDMGGMLGGLVTRIWPVAAAAAVVGIALAGLTREINKTSKETVSLGDTALATWQIITEGLYSLVKPAVDAVSPWFEAAWDRVVEATAGSFNMMARGIYIFLAQVELVAASIKNVFNLTWEDVANFGIDRMQDLINSIMVDVNAFRRLFGAEALKLDLTPHKFEGGGGWSKEAIEKYNARVSTIQDNDYARGFFSDVSTRAQSIASAPTEAELKAMAKEAERQREAYDDLTRSAQQRIAQAQLEVATLGMTREAAERYRITQELLNKAANDNIDLTPRQTAELRLLAEQTAAVEESARQLKETYEFGRETFRSFFSDFKSDLMNSVSLWDAFANAGANALNRIADRALGMAADGIFDMIFGAVMGGVSGGFGGGATGGAWGNGLWGSAIFNAKGNVYASAGLHSYANQVVDRPTVFPFAKGGTFGVMGEAGAEAIMPLRRGRDGKLGVAANDSGITLKVENVNMTGRSLRVESRVENRGGERVLRNLIRDEVQQSTRRAAI